MSKQNTFCIVKNIRTKEKKLSNHPKKTLTIKNKFNLRGDIIPSEYYPYPWKD